MRISIASDCESHRLAADRPHHDAAAQVNDYLGQLHLKGQPPVLVQRINCLLRGSQLRSTSWVYGLVLSTGRDTKANFGSGAVQMKQPTTLRLLNEYLITIFFITLAVSGVAAGVNLAISHSAPQLRDWWFLGDSLQPNWGRSFGMHFLLSYMLIPTVRRRCRPAVQSIPRGRLAVRPLRVRRWRVPRPCCSPAPPPTHTSPNRHPCRAVQTLFSTMPLVWFLASSHCLRAASTLHCSTDPWLLVASHPWACSCRCYRCRRPLRLRCCCRPF